MITAAQVTGLMFFSDNTDALPGLVPNVLLFGLELVWERAGVRGIQNESLNPLIVFWILSLALPTFIIVVFIVSGMSQ